MVPWFGFSEAGSYMCSARMVLRRLSTAPDGYDGSVGDNTLHAANADKSEGGGGCGRGGRAQK